MLRHGSRQPRKRGRIGVKSGRRACRSLDWRWRSARRCSCSRELERLPQCGESRPVGADGRHRSPSTRLGMPPSCLHSAPRSSPRAGPSQRTRACRQRRPHRLPPHRLEWIPPSSSCSRRIFGRPSRMSRTTGPRVPARGCTTPSDLEWARLDSDTPANRRFLSSEVPPGSARGEHERRYGQVLRPPKQHPRRSSADVKPRAGDRARRSGRRRRRALRPRRSLRSRTRR